LKSLSKIPKELSADKFPSLDGMRAICIGLVVLAHLSNAYPLNDSMRTIFRQIGILGVQVFFVISGFLITTLLLKEKINTGNISLRSFYIRRGLRILPVAFLYLICMFVLNRIFQLNIPAASFIGAVFFLSNLARFHGGWYTDHYWSLSIEEQYYLVFPLMLKKFTAKIHWAILFFIFFIILLRIIAYSQRFPDWPWLQTLGWLIYQSDGVLTGSLLSVLCFRNIIPFNFLIRYSLIFSLILPFLIWAFHANLLGYGAINPFIACLLISIFLLCNIIKQGTVFYNFLNNKHIMFIGKLSFSIYIWQQFFTSTDGRFGRFARLPINIIMIAVVSYCSYFFFEKKFLKIKDKFKRAVR
jgi:peptidoglycan/LPS O-acetylase OafA/YrhL